MELDRHEISFEEQLNIRTNINDIDLDMVEIYKKAIGANENELLDVLRARRFLIKDDMSQKEFLTNAGTLLFAKDPSLFFPTARMRVIKFEGKEMQTGADLNIVKDKTFAMPLYKQIKETKIFIYDDRMEILSPGDLPGIVTINNIKEKRYARNPIISRVLTELGVVRELNEGVSRIYREMSDLFLEDPIYIEEKGSSLKLILKNNIVMRSKRKK